MSQLSSAYGGQTHNEWDGGRGGPGFTQGFTDFFTGEGYYADPRATYLDGAWDISDKPINLPVRGNVVDHGRGPVDVRGYDSAGNLLPGWKLGLDGIPYNASLSGIHDPGGIYYDPDAGGSGNNNIFNGGTPPINSNPTGGWTLDQVPGFDPNQPWGGVGIENNPIGGSNNIFNGGTPYINPNPVWGAPAYYRLPGEQQTGMFNNPYQTGSGGFYNPYRFGQIDYPYGSGYGGTQDSPWWMSPDMGQPWYQSFPYSGTQPTTPQQPATPTPTPTPTSGSEYETGPVYATAEDAMASDDYWAAYRKDHAKWRAENPNAGMFDYPGNLVLGNLIYTIREIQH